MTGTLGTILQLLKLPDGTVKALVEGKKRVLVKKFGDTLNTLEAVISVVTEKNITLLRKIKLIFCTQFLKII